MPECNQPCSYVAIVETKMDGFEKKLDELVREVRESNKTLNLIITNQAVDNKDISNIGAKCDSNDTRLRILESKQQYLIAKVSTSASVITIFLAAILN